MPEAERMRNLEVALSALASRIDYPATPSLAPSVTARLAAEQARRGRPPFPGLALWPHKRILAFAVIGVLLLAGTAVAARIAIGAIEIQVVPTFPTPRPTVVERGGAIGEPIPFREASDRVRFGVQLPSELGTPDDAYLIRSPWGSRSLALTWSPSAGLPIAGGTPYGAILMEFPGEAAFVHKILGAENSFETVDVNGDEAYWIEGTHELVISTPAGEQRYLVSGNVLIWQRGRLTLRLETALDLADAVRVADSAS